MKTITEELQDFKSIEKIIFKIMCKVSCELMEGYLKICDQQVLAQRDTKEYRFIRFGTTTIKTLMGEVSYTRRYYKKKTGEYVYLLDEALGIKDDCGLVSENLIEHMVVECSEKSYRKAAESITELTGQAISPMGIWSIFQQYGQRIEKQEERLKELSEAGIFGQIAEIIGAILFEEYDDVWLSTQKEKRHREGEPEGENQKKAGKKPLHVGIAYTGWRQAKDGRYNTVDKIAYASYEDIQSFLSGFEILKQQYFDIDGIQQRVTNGDGASWIRIAAENIDSILQLDPFHRDRAIIRAIRDKNEQNRVFEAINDKDIPKTLQIIYGMITEAQDESTIKKLGELYDYFYNNKDILLGWQERGLKFPEPPEGIVYRNLGVQESSNCNVITQRMKGRKASWSTKGAHHMAKVLCFRNTIGLDAIVGDLQELSPMAIPASALSAAKTPQYDGKGYGGAWLQAEMPFADVMTTNGRRAIQSLLSQRSISELRYI